VEGGGARPWRTHPNRPRTSRSRKGRWRTSESAWQARSPRPLRSPHRACWRPRCALARGGDIDVVDATSRSRRSQLREAGEQSAVIGLSRRGNATASDAAARLPGCGRDRVADFESGRLEQRRPGVAVGRDRVDIDGQAHGTDGAAWPTIGASYAPAHRRASALLLASRNRTVPIARSVEDATTARRPCSPVPRPARPARSCPAFPRMDGGVLRRALTLLGVYSFGQIDIITFHVNWVDARELPPRQRPALPRSDRAEPVPELRRDARVPRRRLSGRALDQPSQRAAADARTRRSDDPLLVVIRVRTYALVNLLEDGGRSLACSTLSRLQPLAEHPLYADRDRHRDRLLLPPAHGAAAVRRTRADRSGAAPRPADLGAPRRRAFRRVVLPLAAPGVIAGCILVGIPATGEYSSRDPRRDKP